MDQIIFCDIDGCLVEGKHVPFNMAGLAQVRHVIGQLAAHDIGFCLCTGRPQPYAEAVAQALGVRTPFICENGAYVFHPKTDKPIMHIKDSKKAGLAKLRKLLLAANYTIEMGNEGSLTISWDGMYSMAEPEIAKHREQMAEHYRAFGFKWTNSSASIDILVKGFSKRNAAAFVLKHFGLKPENAYAIGDSENDRKLLDFIEVPMCPANASADIKARCVTIASKPYVLGVVELLNGVLTAVSEPDTTT
jgi:HAD superfamily hydrolase (TIGR01484 family)